MKPSLAPYLLIAIALLFSFVCLVESHAAQERQYLLLHSLYVFEYQDIAPFEAIRPMAWNAETGFSEISETPDYLYTIVWLDDGLLRHGYVLRDVSSGDCFLLGMQDDDSLLDPHVNEHEWITCND